jgi:tetratricopeptide (TPR) repeat protein
VSERPTTSDTRQVQGLQARIDELWDFDDPAASASRFREAAANASTERERAILETQAARALGLQQRFDEAFALLDALQPPHGEDSELEVRSALERGRAHNSTGERDAARPLFEAAFELASSRGMENLAVDALHMMAIVAEPAEQLALNERAIAIAEGASDPRARQWLASLYNNTGWTRFDAGELDEALRLFELALEERRKRADPRTTNIARWAVARTLRAKGRTAEALAEQQAIQSANAEAGIDDPYVDEEIAECLLALGRPEEARPHFARAAAGLEAELSHSEPARIARLQELGQRPGEPRHPPTD